MSGSCCSDLSEPSGSSAGEELADEIDNDEDDDDVIDLMDEAPPETTGQLTQCCCVTWKTSWTCHAPGKELGTTEYLCTPAGFVLDHCSCRYKIYGFFQHRDAQRILMLNRQSRQGRARQHLSKASCKAGLVLSYLVCGFVEHDYPMLALP